MMPPAGRRSLSTSRRIVIAAVCQPLAASPPKKVVRAASSMERSDIVMPWAFGDYALFINQAIEPLFECRNAYDWVSDLARRFHIADAFTEGKTAEDWLRQMVDTARAAWPDFPTFEAFRERGVYKYRHPAPHVVFREQIAGEKPFPTPSGKIEIYSPRLAAMDQPHEIPAIPKYIPAWEGPSDPARAQYPLQCIGWHYKRRCHSIYDNSPWLEEVARQEAWLNPADAAKRRIKNGDPVRVFNERGAIVLLNISYQYGPERVRELSGPASGYRHLGLAAGTDWVPFELTRPELLDCLHIYDHEEENGGNRYAFMENGGNRSVLDAREALRLYTSTGASPLSKWQTHIFQYLG
jgi:hypothetical protein